MDVSKLGSKIGPRIAELVAQTYISTKLQGADFQAQVSRYMVDESLKVLSAALGDSHSILLDKLSKSEAAPAEVQPLLEQMQGTPALMEVVKKLCDLFGIMAAANHIGANDWAPTIQGYLAADPNVPLPPEIWARMVAQHLSTKDNAVTQSLRSGTSASSVDYLIESAYIWPGLAEVLELKRRGVLGLAQVEFLLQRQGYRDDTIQDLLNLEEAVLSPEIAALAVLKGWMSESDGIAEALKSGVNPSRFKWLEDVTGEPPGLMEMLEAYRRKIIDQPRLEKGIRESRVRNEWIDVVEALRYMPPAPAACVEGAVKGHLTPAESQAKAERAGLDPAEWQWLFQTTGNPPGAMEMVSLWNRGVVDQDRVVQALKQGHLANEFIPDVLELKRRLPEISETLLMQQSGVWTRAKTVHHLIMHGFIPEDAADIAAAGSRAKINADWTLAKQIATAQYSLGIISRSDAVSSLEGVGFENDEADAVIAVVDLQRIASQQSSALDKIRSLYIAYRLDEVTCRAALGSLHVAGEQINEIMLLWGLEREANIKQLSETQIVDAFYYEIIDQGEAQGELESIGYTPHDAWTLLSIKAKQKLLGEPPLQG